MLIRPPRSTLSSSSAASDVYKRQVYALWMTIKGFGIRSIDDSREGTARFLKRNPTTSIVAEADGKLVGAILCGHDGRTGCFYHVCVNEAYRNHGIGKQMATAAMRALQREQINKAVSYTHLTLPTKRIVKIQVVAVT